VKRDVLIHVKLDTYVKLSELKARLRKRSFDDVVKELVEAYERLHEKSWVRQCLQ